jgi:hypothetical protein
MCLKKFFGLMQLVLLSFFSVSLTPVAAATITWAGQTWNVTTGGMAGNNTGSASNVIIDADGYLHLKIAKQNTTWTCAELFTTDKLGFGTYRWQIDSPVDKLDKNVVLGLFPYGPTSGIGDDGTNEIDIEYARWGNSAWPNGNYTVYPNSGSTVGEITFNFTLIGTFSTSSFLWTKNSIAYSSQEGFKVTGDTSGTIKTWTYAPSNPSINIPQQPIPLGMNLWLCGECGGAPSDGNPVEVIIRNFQYLPEGTSTIVSNPHSRPPATAMCTVHNGTVRIELDQVINQVVSVKIHDTRGRLIRSERIPSGARLISLPGIEAGLLVFSIPELGIAQQTIFTR